MNKTFESSYEELLDKLFEIQTEIQEKRSENDDTLCRILELDMYKILDKLKITACDYCQYKIINKDKKCDLEMRCQSYVLLKKINKTNENINTKLEFMFRLI